MLSLLWFLLLVGVILFVAYRRFSLLQASITFTVLALAYTLLGPAVPAGRSWAGCRSSRSGC